MEGAPAPPISNSFFPSGVQRAPLDCRKSSPPIMCSCPFASSFTHTWGRSCLSCRAKEIHLPSGEYCAAATLPASLCATMSVLPLSTSTMRSLWSLPLHIRVLASGAQTIPLLSQSASLIFFTVLPNSSERYTSSRPERSLTNAIHFPLGDQRGS